MKRKQIFFAVCAGMGILPMAASAQASQDASAVTATVVRDPARQASTEIDAAIFNPAGTSFLEEGWHLSLNGNLSYRTMTVTNQSERTNVAQKMRNDIPSLQAAYKKNDWTVSLSFANEGGYGVWNSAENAAVSRMLNHLNGPIFDIYKSAMVAFSDNINYGDQLVSVAMESGDLYNFSTRIGASYKINPHWSVYAGVRYNYTTEKTVLGVDRWVYTSAGEVKTPRAYFSAIDDDFQRISDDAIEMTGLLPVYELLGMDASNMTLEGAQALIGFWNRQIAGTKSYSELINERTNAWGLTPVIGVDYQIGQFNFGAKYEFETKMHTGQGVASYHIPSLLSLGASWRPNEKLQIALGGSWSYLSKDVYGHHQQSNKIRDNDSFFNFGKMELYALMPNDMTGTVAYDYSASISFSPIKDLTLSVGYTYAVGHPLQKDFWRQSLAAEGVDADVLSGGLRYRLSPKVDLDFGMSKKIATKSFYNGWQDRIEGLEDFNVSAGISVHL